MAWNDPGNNNPWSNGSGNRGSNNGSNNGGPRKPNDNEPDLDELARKLQEKLSGIFGGKGGNGNGKGSSAGGFGGIALLVLVLVVIGLAASAMHVVKPTEQAIVLRFGEYAGTLNSGFNLQMPWPIDRVIKRDVTTVREHKLSRLMLTKDKNIVNVEVKVQYVIDDVKKYLLNLVDADASLAKATSSALRETVGRSAMDQVLKDDRAGIEQQTMEQLVTVLSGYEAGILVTSVNLDKVTPPTEPKVREAFDDAVSADGFRKQLINEGQAYANDILPKARGAAARVVAEAEAEKVKVVQRALGDVARYEALLNEYQAAPQILRDRLYLETMRDVLGNTSKVIVDTKEGGNTLMYLPLDKLVGNRPAAAANAANSDESQSLGAAAAKAANRYQDSRSRDSRYREAR